MIFILRGQTVIRRVDLYDSPMAIRLVGVRHHGVVPNSVTIDEVPDSGHRLFHQMGRKRSLGLHHREEREKLRME